MSPVYTFHGCRLRSDIPLSLVGRCAEQDDAADAVLRCASVPPALSAPVWSSPFVSVDGDGAVLIDVPAVGRFLVRGGREIVVEPAPTTTPGELEAVLLAAAAAPLLHQRGALPLQASCVAVDGVAVALAGSSGRGKSALAAALLRRGAELVSDDLTALSFAADGSAVAQPGVAGLCLWPDARQLLGEGHAWTPLRAGHAKCVAGVDRSVREPRRLAAVIRLAGDRGDVTPGLRRLTGQAAMAPPVSEVVARYALGQRLGRGSSLMRSALRLAAAAPFYELFRPRSLAEIDEAAGSVLDAVRRG